jgi:3-oxoacyl-[acyl-carrier protein] reductase
MNLGLAGKRVIVTAASEGIARAAAEKFVAEGAHVAICSRDAVKVERAANALRTHAKGEVIAEAVDVTDTAALAQFVAKVEEQFGGVDICVANAGGPPARMFLETSPEEWQRAFELNMLSTIELCRAVLAGMQQRGWGRIIAITSVSTRQPIGDLIYSNTIRAGVLGLLKSLSNEFGKNGITINNVAPGYTLTDRMQQLIETRSAASGVTRDEFLAQLMADTPLRRAGRPEEVADAIVFLASERASYITGQTLLVDGGLYKGL